MFTTILGIPAHPLLIHAAVVFVPLLIAAAVVYVLWPAARRRLDWAVVGLAIVAPLSVWFARVSGVNFRARLINRHLVSPAILAKITQHESYGKTTVWWTLALGVISLIMVAYARSRRSRPWSGVAWVGFVVVILALSGFAGYYIFRTGDTGAHIVWTGF